MAAPATLNHTPAKRGHRWTCPNCKRTFNAEFIPPTAQGICDTCGFQLERRADDDQLTILRRLAVYRDQTEPLEAFYRERDLLQEIDAEAREDTVGERTLSALASIT